MPALSQGMRVDRTKSKGFCGAGDGLKISSVGPHFGEERQLVGRRGSGTIFLPTAISAVYTARIISLALWERFRLYQRTAGSHDADAPRTLRVLQYQFGNPTHLNLLRVDAIILAAWTFYDIRKRRDHFGWVIGVLIAGVLVLPVYLAKRSLKPGETREGGTGWNVLKTLL